MDEKKQVLAVGELAKKMNVSVRTIQYYDQIGLLSPSGFTEGGRRLYSMKDYMTLYQIISLKEFGFSLNEIKKRLMPADSVEEIEEYLMSQENNIQKQIKILEKKYELINKFINEIKKINEIDWELFVEILSLLRNEDENYWIVKYFDKDVFEKIKNKHTEEKGERFIERMTDLCDLALELQMKGISSDSEEALKLAKTWWQEIMIFTNGDMDMIQQMVNISSVEEGSHSAFMKKFKMSEGYISDVLTVYFQKSGIESIQRNGDVDDD